jgi:hypothetical protein
MRGLTFVAVLAALVLEELAVLAFGHAQRYKHRFYAGITLEHVYRETGFVLNTTVRVL